MEEGFRVVGRKLAHFQNSVPAQGGKLTSRKKNTFFEFGFVPGAALGIILGLRFEVLWELFRCRFRTFGFPWGAVAHLRTSLGIFGVSLGCLGRF